MPLLLKYNIQFIETNASPFEDASGEEIWSMWDKVNFRASLWASITSEFKDVFFFLYSTKLGGFNHLAREVFVQICLGIFSVEVFGTGEVFSFCFVL